MKIKNAHIRASKHSNGNIYYDLRASVMFDKCRTWKNLSFSPMSQKIWCKPMQGYNGSANIRPSEWKDFVKNLPVVKDKLFPIDEITDEIRDKAHRNLDYWFSECPAVNTQIHYSISIIYDKLEVVQ